MQLDVEVHLAHRLAGRFDQQLEQLQHLLFAVQVGFDGLADDVLELFTVFKERWPVLGLDVEQEALVAGIADQRGAFVAVGDEFERFLPHSRW